MYTLGINAVYHDSSACLVRDGGIVAAAEEERFTRIKHGKRPVPFSTYELPFHAIDYCLKEAGIELADLDHVAYSYNPYLLLGRHTGQETITLPLEPSAHPTPEEWLSAWDPLFLSHVVNAPRQLVDGVPHHLQARFRSARHRCDYDWHFTDHHLSHAASAYLAAPFEHAAVMTLDGRGERATTSYRFGHGADLELLGEVRMPHSLGLLYEAVTEYLGFLRSSDEYKVMAMASYGKPAYLEEFRRIVRVGENGQYTVDPELDLEERLGPRRLRGGPYESRHFDIAHSLQKILEESALALAEWLHEKTGAENLCLAGGVALNCVMNARLRDRGPFKQIWVQPAAGDAGSSLGAALWTDAQKRKAVSHAAMIHPYYGPSYGDEEIRKFLDWSKLPYRKMEDVAEETAEILAQDKIIGWFQGRMEFGPRALGGRSILASPIHPDMQARLNEVKDREEFRPVAPVVLEEEAAEWFVDGGASPYMLFVYDVRPEKADLIPAVRHVDGTARVQTVNRDQHPRYCDLLEAFRRRTGVPVLVNTSFNTRGEPIVCSPRDAVECFWTSPLDALVIGSFLLEKKEAGKEAPERRSDEEPAVLS